MCLEFPSREVKSFNTPSAEKGPIFWIRQKNWPSWRRWILFVSKNQRLEGVHRSYFLCFISFSTHSIFQHENEVILMLPNMARSCYFLSPFDPLNGKSHRLCWKILRSTRSRLPWCKNWCRSRGMRIFPCKPLQEPQIHRVIWWLGRFSITPLVLNCGGESMFFLFFT